MLNFIEKFLFENYRIELVFFNFCVLKSSILHPNSEIDNFVVGDWRKIKFCSKIDKLSHNFEFKTISHLKEV